MGYRNGRNINHVMKGFGREGLKSKFFSIRGILTFFHKGKKIIETKNMLLNNPHYNSYVLEDKTIEWSIYDQDCIYEKGIHKLKNIYNEDEIKLEHDKRFLKFFVSPIFMFSFLTLNPLVLPFSVNVKRLFSQTSNSKIYIAFINN